MREIKFRAWDKEEKRFWSEEEMNKIGGYYYTFGVSDNDGEFVLQQYTGLKDKNGKEIYEGDILSMIADKKSPSGGYYGGTIGHHPENAKVVSWEDGRWALDQTKSLNDELIFQSRYGGLEIIGNIYETPNLIKDSTK